jgi:CHASE1-domain containing sensor protein
MAAVTDQVTGRTHYWIALPWLVMLLGIAASFLLFAVVRDAVESVGRQRFERLASDTRYVIQARIDSYGEILFGLAAFFGSQAVVTRLQFHRYVESLDLKNRFPGFDVLNFAVRVGAEDKKRFEEEVRRDTSLNPNGYPDFRIKPPGERPEYYVLVYVEPMTGFEFAFGLDTSVNPAIEDSKALMASINLTRDSGGLNSPGLPIRVKRWGKEYIGLGMRLGVYRSGMPHSTVEQRRAAFFGSVGAGINVENLMKGVIDDETAMYLRFKLYGAEVEADTALTRAEKRWLLFDSDQLIQGAGPGHAAATMSSVFTNILPMEVGGRTWEVHFSARKDAIINRVDALFPWMVLGGVLFSSMMLSGMFYSLASSRSRAVEIANEITRELRESEEELRASAEQLQAMSRRLVDLQ